MLLYVYLVIIALLLVFIIWNMFDEKDVLKQIDAALVIVALALRLLLIK